MNRIACLVFQSAACDRNQPERAASISPAGRFCHACLLALALAASLSMTAAAQWRMCGTAVAQTRTAQVQTLPKISADGHGGAYVVWMEWRTQDADIYAQHITSNGVLTWGMYGAQVSIGDGTWGQAWPEILADDNDGGVFVAWELDRYLQVQKLDTAGNPLWGPNGVSANMRYTVLGISLASDGAGGVYAATGGLDTTAFYTPWVQHFDASGRRLFGEFGISLSPRGHLITLSNCRVLRQGSRGAVLAAWMENEYPGYDSRVYAQILDFDGTPRWTGGGVALQDTGLTRGNMIRMRSDDAGGAYIQWQTGLPEVETLQHLDSSGAAGFGKDGMLVWEGQSPNDLAPDGRGGILMGAGTWRHPRFPDPAANSYSAQRIAPDGRRMWTDTGVVVVPTGGYTYGRGLVSDGAGGAFIVYRPNSIPKTVYLQWIDSAGNLPFGAGFGLFLCRTDSGDVEDFDAVATAPGEAMLAFEKPRDGGGKGVTMPNGVTVLKVTKDGLVGLKDIPAPPAASMELGAVRPNPSRAASAITVRLAYPSQVRVAIGDVMGRELRVLTDNTRPAGSFEVMIDESDLAPGTYFITARAGMELQTRKLIVLPR